jgi:hypothetical protein
MLSYVICVGGIACPPPRLTSEKKEGIFPNSLWLGTCIGRGKKKINK